LIISHKKKFVFLRTVKTASSSMAVYLSQFCSKKDTISSLGAFATDDEDKFKKRYGLPGAQNYILKKKSFGIKNFINLNFYNNVNIHTHDSIDKVLKTEIGKKIKDYFFFCLVRNPFDTMVSNFWWHIYIQNKKNLNWINKLSKNEITSMFKSFLDEFSQEYFDKQRSVVTNKEVNIRVFKYENFDENLKKIKKKLNLKKEIIPIKNIRFKKLNIKKKILIDKKDEKKILESGEFFFNEYYTNETLPEKYKK
jgi:hypothetical protein